MEPSVGIRVEGLCLAELIEMTEAPVIESIADLTWDETHHLLVPLLRADNHTNILYILGDYAGLATSLVGCGRIYRLWWAGQLLDCTVSTSVNCGRDADRRVAESTLGTGA